jgi:hypothetical protein
LGRRGEWLARGEWCFQYDGGGWVGVELRLRAKKYKRGEVVHRIASHSIAAALTLFISIPIFICPTQKYFI